MNCSAQRPPTRAVADRSIVDTTPAAQLLRQSRSVRPRCRTSPLTQAKPPCGDDSKEYAASRYRRKSYGGAGGGCACLPAEKHPKLSRFTKGSREQARWSCGDKRNRSMKQRHKLQRQRPRPASAKRRPATYEEANEQQQPSASKAKRRSTYQGQVEGGRTKHRLDKSRRGGRQPKRFDDGGIADASPAKPPALAYGNGPPAPPQIGNDGTPIPPAAPRANDPRFSE